MPVQVVASAKEVVAAAAVVELAAVEAMLEAETTFVAKVVGCDFVVLVLVFIDEFCTVEDAAAAAGMEEMAAEVAEDAIAEDAAADETGAAMEDATSEDEATAEETGATTEDTTAEDEAATATAEAAEVVFCTRVTATMLETLLAADDAATAVLEVEAALVVLLLSPALIQAKLICLVLAVAAVSYPETASRLHVILT